jgi:hypothetical protein
MSAILIAAGNDDKRLTRIGIQQPNPIAGVSCPVSEKRRSRIYLADQPPSRKMIWPVIYPEAGEARKMVSP